MRAQEYVEAFPRTLPVYEADLVQPELLQDPHEQVLGWSYRFGKLLHDHMGGIESDAFPNSEATAEYVGWNMGTITDHLNLFHVSDQEAEHRNTANFHALNRSLAASWHDILPPHARLPRIPDIERRQFALRFMQQALAYEAVDYLVDRYNYIKEGGGTQVLFNSTDLSDGRVISAGEFTEVVGRGQGVIQEFELAIVAIEALIRFPHLLGRHTTLLPAPIQFEKTNQATNADLILYDPTPGGHAIGLQSKMGVTEEDLMAIDPDRVVLVDGKIDFNSVRPVRTSRGSSREAVVAWPGMIAAKVISELVLAGKRKSPLVVAGEHPALLQNQNMLKGKKPLNSRGIMAARFVTLREHRHAVGNAKTLLGNTRVDLVSLSKRIAERVAPKL